MSKTYKSEDNIFDYKYTDWWDKLGSFRPLHKFNITRIDYILKIIKRKKLYSYKNCLKGLSILDVGCGGGILSEPLSRLGAQVLGIDISESAINIAKAHAKDMSLDIDYQCIDIENLSKKENNFDIIIISEVIEHVENRMEFLDNIYKLGQKNSLVFITTINKSFSGIVFAKYFAEYVAKILPKGTHDWNKFVSPKTLKFEAKKSNILIDDFTGISFNPISNSFYLSSFLNINYAASGEIK